MWKTKIFIVIITNIPFICKSNDINNTFDFLDCETPFVIEKKFNYSVKLKMFSKFQLGKKTKQDIFQFDFLIDPMFRFPTENTEKKFIPSISKSETLICYTDYLPDNIHYLYESAKNNNRDISLYFSNEENYRITIFSK